MFLTAASRQRTGGPGGQLPDQSLSKFRSSPSPVTHPVTGTPISANKREPFVVRRSHSPGTPAFAGPARAPELAWGGQEGEDGKYISVHP